MNQTPSSNALPHETAPPPATPGFKVHISLGKRIGRASSEWFSRPDDERYLSLSALHGAVLSGDGLLAGPPEVGLVAPEPMQHDSELA